MRVTSDKMKRLIRAILSDMPESTVDEPNNWETDFVVASAFIDKWKAKHDAWRKTASPSPRPRPEPQKPAAPASPPGAPETGRDPIFDVLHCLTMIIKDMEGIPRKGDIPRISDFQRAMNQINEIHLAKLEKMEPRYSVDISGSSKADIIESVRNSWIRSAVVAWISFAVGAILAGVVAATPAIRSHLDPIYRCEVSGGQVGYNAAQQRYCLTWLDQAAR